MAGGAQLGPLRVPLVWNAKDGQITFVFLFGSALGPFTRKFVDYLYEQGGCDQAMRDTDWVGYGAELLSGRVPVRHVWTVAVLLSLAVPAVPKAVVETSYTPAGIPYEEAFLPADSPDLEVPASVADASGRILASVMVPLRSAG